MKKKCSTCDGRGYHFYSGCNAQTYPCDDCKPPKQEQVMTSPAHPKDVIQAFLEEIAHLLTDGNKGEK